MMSKLKRYRPALILLLTKVCGFSTKRSIYPSSWATITPYRLGFSTLVTMMVPCLPCYLWNSTSWDKGYSQITSELNTKKSPVSLFSFIIYSASLSGPAVPSGSLSNEIVILMPYYRQNFMVSVGICWAERSAYLWFVIGNCCHHNLWLVVNCKNDLRNTGFYKSFNLVA